MVNRPVVTPCPLSGVPLSAADPHGAPDHFDFNSSFTWHAYVQLDGGGNAGILSRSPESSNWNQGSKAMFIESNGHLEWDTGWVSNPRTGDYINDDVVNFITDLEE